ncbi:hypothetical protein [Nonomuraea sp. NPDC048916]|uniref:hypothetical protein n=1 Tax=Nonomuraea sp. NPDC048916 TaxID=3154232 RepID=UPI0033F71F8F
MTMIDPARIQTSQDLTEQLAELFHQGGWSIQRLATAASLSPATVHAMINGTTEIPRAGSLSAFVTACHQPSDLWLQARARVIQGGRSSQPSQTALLQAQLDEMRERTERAETALAATGQSPDQLIREATLARLQDLAERDPVVGDHENGHLYLIVHPVAGREDALAGLFDDDPVRQLHAVVHQVVQARGGEPFSPDLTSGVWQPCSDGFMSVRGIDDSGQVREASLLEVFVFDNGGVAVLCGRGTTYAHSKWRPLGQSGTPPVRRVIFPSLVLGLTHGALALAGELASRYASYQGQWQIGLRLDGLQGAMAYDYVEHGDDDTVRLYDRPAYERTALCTTEQLLEQPAVFTERLVGPLLRGLAIAPRYLPYGAR